MVLWRAREIVLVEGQTSADEALTPVSPGEPTGELTGSAPAHLRSFRISEARAERLPASLGQMSRLTEERPRQPPRRKQ